jgi:hypothetical protein
LVLDGERDFQDVEMERENGDVFLMISFAV